MLLLAILLSVTLVTLSALYMLRGGKIEELGRTLAEAIESLGTQMAEIGLLRGLLDRAIIREGEAEKNMRLHQSLKEQVAKECAEATNKLSEREQEDRLDYLGARELVQTHKSGSMILRRLVSAVEERVAEVLNLKNDKAAIHDLLRGSIVNWEGMPMLKGKKYRLVSARKQATARKVRGLGEANKSRRGARLR